MRSLFGEAAARATQTLPLFPLHTVLFPGGLLSLKVFEQRYVDMTKDCLKDGRPFGVCLITRGEEVATAGAEPPEFAPVGTLAHIASCDMPQLGILHVATSGGARFQVRRHEISPSGLAIGEVAPIPAEPACALTDEYASLARLLEVIVARIPAQSFPTERRYGDASWVGYRLAELLPLPPSIKQGMLEISDAQVRLDALRKFLDRHGLL